MISELIVLPKKAPLLCYGCTPMKYKIESSGNGACWTITRLSDNASLFLQGEDALIFGKELESTHDLYTDDDVCSIYDSQLMPGGAA